MISEYKKSGVLPAETPIFTANGIKLYTDEKNVAVLKKQLNGQESLAEYLRAHLNRLGAGDYFALLAYIEMNEAHERVLQAMRQGVRAAKCVATCLEFGPRFLQSTGQAYKGGPNTGYFCKSPATMLTIYPCRGKNTRSVWSKRPRPEEIFRFSWSASAALYALISVRIS